VSVGRSPPPRPVSLLRNRKRETKTHRSTQRLAGKAANRSNTTRRAPQLITLTRWFFHLSRLSAVRLPRRIKPTRRRRGATGAAAMLLKLVALSLWGSDRIGKRCNQLFSKHSSPPSGFGRTGGVPFSHSIHCSPPQGFGLAGGVLFMRLSRTAVRRTAGAAVWRKAVLPCCGTAVLRWSGPDCW
jgi:hypothetical protein